MESSLVTWLTQRPLTVNARFLELELRFILILLIAALVLIIWLLIFQAVLSLRFKKIDNLRQLLKDAAADAIANSSLIAKNVLPPAEELLSPANIGILAEQLEKMPQKPQNALRSLLTQLDCKKFISRQLKDTDNDEYIVDLLRIAGNLNIVTLAYDIEKLIKLYMDNTEIVFEAFHTLARLDNNEYFMHVCMEDGFARTMSFRSLLDIILAYSGDRKALYRKLLEAPDDYIVRICIKRIGAEGIVSLAPKVLTYLDSRNFNLIIDALRTIGTLKYRPAAKKAIEFFKHERWEVRNAAVCAVSAIDVVHYSNELIEALQDREWFVRYNAGQALSAIADTEDIQAKIVATNDKFAIEMLEYMTQMRELRKGVAI